MKSTRQIQIHLVRAVAQDDAASRAMLHALLNMYRDTRDKDEYEWLKNLLKTEREYLKLYSSLRKLRRRSFRERVATLHGLRIPHNHHSDDTSPMRKCLCKLAKDMAREANAEACAVRGMLGM